MLRTSLSGAPAQVRLDVVDAGGVLEFQGILEFLGHLGEQAAMALRRLFVHTLQQQNAR